MARKSESSGKQEALARALADVNKKHGDRSAFRMDGTATVEGVQTIPTGSLALNLALGVGGYPRGRIVEIFGPEASGKTTLALHAISECQALSLIHI